MIFAGDCWSLTEIKSLEFNGLEILRAFSAARQTGTSNGLGTFACDILTSMRCGRMLSHEEWGSDSDELAYAL